MFESFDSTAYFFLICAVLGGIPFILKLIMMLFGGALPDDLDIPDSHPDSTLDFKIFSIQSITAFLMMFGLIGLAMYVQSGFGFLISMLAGLVAGGITFYLITKIFLFLPKLDSSGNIEPVDTIGCEGTVYISIHPDTGGTVNVLVQDRQREYDAVSSNNEELKAGTSIRVIGYNGKSLVVEKI